MRFRMRLAGKRGGVGSSSATALAPVAPAGRRPSFRTKLLFGGSDSKADCDRSHQTQVTADTLQSDTGCRDSVYHPVDADGDAVAAAVRQRRFPGQQQRQSSRSSLCRIAPNSPVDTDDSVDEFLTRSDRRARASPAAWALKRLLPSSHPEAMFEHSSIEQDADEEAGALPAEEADLRLESFALQRSVDEAMMLQGEMSRKMEHLVRTHEASARDYEGRLATLRDELRRRDELCATLREELERKDEQSAALREENEILRVALIMEDDGCGGDRSAECHVVS